MAKSEMKFLNSKERKVLKQLLAEQFGYTGDLKFGSGKNAGGGSGGGSGCEPFVFFMSGRKDKVYALSRDAAEYPYEELRVDTLGLYIGAYVGSETKEFRLSVEGTQLIGPDCTKNILLVSDAQYNDWVRGRDILYESDDRGFVLLARDHPVTGKREFLGCGKVVRKHEAGKEEATTLIHNYVPKSRYVRSEE